MNNQDMKMIHGNSMSFVDELVDTVLTIKERYKLDEQTALEICKLSATLYNSSMAFDRLNGQSKNADKIQDGLESIASAIWQTN
ncbi:hypothetical protein Si018_00726 [Streptococcus infantarius subsp. infantarius]|nr:hypothetical protein [Streptococcus infantarius subsp. infantarius]